MLRGLIAAAALTLQACAGSNVYTGVDGGPHRMDELRIGRRASAAPAAPVPAQAEAATVASAAPDASPTLTPESIGDARRRLDTFLNAEGFTAEESGTASGYRITATRMTEAAGASVEAICTLKALHRPEIYATTLDIRLTPSALAGVRLGVVARFVEIDQGVVSGALSKRACQSRGVLEAEVRHATLGG